MPATDQQMQTYADSRIRRRAAVLRAEINALRDDVAAIGAGGEYDRALNGPAWADARTDGPAKLLANQDFLVFNSVADTLLHMIDGQLLPGRTAQQMIDDLHANWPLFMAMAPNALDT